MAGMGMTHVIRTAPGGFSRAESPDVPTACVTGSP